MDLIRQVEGEKILLLDDTLGNQNVIATFYNAMEFDVYVDGLKSQHGWNRFTLYDEVSETYLIELDRTVSDPGPLGDRPFFWPIFY
jgi:hypothetical protein